jgi:hypothetical protein
MRDHEDHSFSGIMFDIVAKDSLPMEYLEIFSVKVRGELGPITVYVAEGGHEGKLGSAKHWNKVFENTVPPSPKTLSELKLTTPVRVLGGQRLGIYVHSKLGNDTAIVYDNVCH